MPKQFNLRRAATVAGLAVILNYVVGIAALFLLFTFMGAMDGLTVLITGLILFGVAGIIAPVLAVIIYEQYKGRNVYDNLEVLLLTVILTVVSAAAWTFVAGEAAVTTIVGLAFAGPLGVFATPAVTLFLLTLAILYLERKTELV